MRSPEGKTLVFSYRSIPAPRPEDCWSASVTVPPGAGGDSALRIRALDGAGEPIASGAFELMGAKVPISGGDGSMTLADFVGGVHEKGVWMFRPGRPPLPGGLTFE